MLSQLTGSLTVMNPTIPSLYALPKIHKENCPMRPIVSYTNAPASKLCKHLNSILPDMIQHDPIYSIKNNIQLTNELKTLKIPTNARLVSFDVVNLFPSIPTTEVEYLVNQQLDENPSITAYMKEETMRLLKICLGQSYFKFNEKFYQQLDGLPMGSPSSNLFSEIFMTALEKKIFSPANVNLTDFVLYWKRYVDDIFCIWTGSNSELESFLELINSFYSSIQFTLEIEDNNKCLNFLDIQVKIINEHLEFNIYRKPTFSDILIHNSSSHPFKIKMSAFHTLVHRLISIPLSATNFDNEVQILKVLAKNNGYHPDIINKLIFKKQQKRLLTLVYPPQLENQMKKFVYINYIPSLSDKLCKRIRKNDIDVICTNKKNLRTMFFSGKNRLNISQLSGVYKLFCDECPAFYIGQTGRSLGIRIEEHKRSILQNKSTTGFSNHCITSNHFIDFNKTKILHRGDKGKRLDLLEFLEISSAQKQNLPIVNDQLDFRLSPVLTSVT
ncbi:uncharacterized protein LOC123683088 [Harmonia axyridis]|uniref:uncharacterized protein LOC123683088 n=1 Tax=Harmonia axyridis TaxID=115357 RepID=UPI001E278C2A|nr:uncharacterized protein LOC123683088 [Harmonia axyridis]